LPPNLRFYPHFFILASLAIALFSVTASIYTYLRGPGVGVEGNPLLDPAPAYTVNRLMFPLTVNSTVGPIRVPVDGKINIITPQYTRCPDICHLETAVMVYVMRVLEDRGYRDAVIWVTIDVDPWSSSMSSVEAYMASKARALAERGSWIWVLDDEGTLRQLWSQLGIRAERDPKTGLVAHTAGFIIVDDRGYIRYHVNPRDWSNVKAIADKVEKLVEDLLRERRS